LNNRPSTAARHGMNSSVSDKYSHFPNASNRQDMDHASEFRLGFPIK
jgi:hypothetical protein